MRDWLKDSFDDPDGQIADWVDNASAAEIRQKVERHHEGGVAGFNEANKDTPKRPDISSQNAPQKRTSAPVAIPGPAKRTPPGRISGTPGIRSGGLVGTSGIKGDAGLQAPPPLRRSPGRIMGTPKQKNPSKKRISSMVKGL